MSTLEPFLIVRFGDLEWDGAWLKISTDVDPGQWGSKSQHVIRTENQQNKFGRRIRKK
jgi:hypothetical protein